MVVRQSDFDWRAHEARLNVFPHYRATFDEIAIHFIHVRSATPGAFPVIITHGWPGSIVEMTEIIPRLTTPRRWTSSCRRYPAMASRPHLASPG